MGRGGRGRRRGRGLALETAMGQFGGMGMGRDFQIDVEVGGRGRTRSVTGDRARRIMLQEARKEGGFSEATEDALRQQMTESGIRDDVKQTNIIDAMKNVAVAKDEPAQKAAADRVQELKTQYGEEFQRVEQEQMNRQVQEGRARDPLGARRNDILELILASPGVTNGPAEGVTVGEGGGVGSGPKQNMSSPP